VDHMAQTETEPDDPMYSPQADLITVRRFRFGTTLADAVELHPDSAAALLERTSRFLGLIHAFETERAGPPVGVRKDLLKKEFGRWLKVGIRAENAAELFASWWAELAEAPALCRRDAHPFNWLVGGDAVFAIDLEATGWRPVGYELAQLTDDCPALPVSENGWLQRARVVQAYTSVLTEHGYDLTYELVWSGYVASLVARAIRGLTDPNGDRKVRAHAERLLRFIAENSDVSQRTQSLARQLLVAWAILRGVGEHQPLSALGEGRRQYISRVLAYQLRHAPDLSVDEEGWASLADLVTALRDGGLKVIESDVLAVASGVDEPRFEVENARVRARYGHTRQTDIKYLPSEYPTILYHGTVVASLNRIFQQSEGLRPMERQWVHLSDRWNVAFRAGRRYGPPVLLEITPSEYRALELYYAGGTTWLAKALPAVVLHVAPLFRIFLRSY